MNSLTVRIKETKDLTSFQENGSNRFREVWNKIAFSLGIRKALTEPELCIILEFMQEFHKTLTLNDVSKAFGLYSAGYLDFNESHYQSLDNVFIGKVLKSYKEWKRKENAKPKLIEVEKQLPEPKSDPKRSFEFICKVWDDEGKLPRIANWKTAFEYAEKEGLINMSDEEKREAFKKKQAEVQRKINDARGKMEDYRKLEFDLQPLNVKSECRKDAIIKYLKEKL